MPARLLVRLLTAPVVVLSLVGVPSLVGVSRAAGPSAPAAVNEGGDFATQTWDDAWDMSNASDMLLDDNGPALNVMSQAMSGGTLHFSINRAAYISPLWTGYPGALQMGRDGSLPQNAINANIFRGFAIRMYSSSTFIGGVDWFSCSNQSGSCEGADPIKFWAGWHTYAMPLSNRSSLPAAWAGWIHGLRLALSPTTATNISIDWIRLYQPGSSGLISGVTAGTNGLYYNVNGVVSCEQLLGTGNNDLAALPPATYRFSGSSSCSPLSAPVSILSRPTPVVDAPNAVGSGDYATSVIRNPWDFNDAGDVSRTLNVCGNTFSNPGGSFSGYNCSANGYTNDSQVYLHVGGGSSAIASSRYHNITVTFTYSGPFNLANACHGGTMGRLFWQDTQHPGLLMQSQDWVTYADRSTYTFNLASSTVNETDAGNKYPFVVPSGSYVTALRWDPNEDQCGRWFHISDVKLNGDYWPVNGVFNVQWNDPRAQAGDSVSIYVRNTSVSGASWQQIASGLPNSGSVQKFAWHTSGFAHGRYQVLVRPYRAGSGYAGQTIGSGLVIV